MKYLTLVIVISTGFFLGGCSSKNYTQSNSLKVSQEKDITATLKTTQGIIKLKLFPTIAPLAVENFTVHINNKYYDNLTFHRVIKGFMIQGGDPTNTGKGGTSIWNKEFINECSNNVVFDRPFLLAMANHGRNTNGSQFFITTKATPWLNGDYTIFGEVISGQDVVKKIEYLKTDKDDRPLIKQTIIDTYADSFFRPKIEKKVYHPTGTFNQMLQIQEERRKRGLKPFGFTGEQSAAILGGSVALAVGGMVKSNYDTSFYNSDSSSTSSSNKSRTTSSSKNAQTSKSCSYKIKYINENARTIKCSNGNRYEMVYRNGEWKKKNKMINRAWSKTIEESAKKVCKCK